MNGRNAAIAMGLLLISAPICLLLTPTPDEAPIDPLFDEGARSTAMPMQRPSIDLEGLQAHFTENLGQVSNAEVRYFSSGGQLSIGLTPGGVVFMLAGDADAGAVARTTDGPAVACFRLDFVGCRAVEPKARSPLGHASSYFIGRDPEGWVRGAANHAEVWYEDVYPGVDLRFYFNEGCLKYDFIVREGGDPAAIRLEYEGVDGISIDEGTGDMLVRTPLGTLRDTRPVVAFSRDGNEASMQADFELLGHLAFGFGLPSEALLCRPLVIDPGLKACTLLGTQDGDESSWSTAMDPQGNIIVGVLVRSSDFPTTTGAYNRTWSSLKGCVLKIDPTMSRLLFSTFYGGTRSSTWGECIDYSITVMRNESILIEGYTITDDFPVTPDAFDRDYNGQMDEYILVLGPNGDRLEYASYFGGVMDDFGCSAILDGFGALYLAGTTYSSDLPTTPGAYQRTKGGSGDVFIAKFDISLRHLQFCTYLGGSSDDWIAQGAVVGRDIYNNIYVAGVTTSNNFPTTAGSYSPAMQGNPPDMFFVKLNEDASRLLYGTYIGGDSMDAPAWMHVTQVGMAIIIGNTKSIDYPVTPYANDTKMDGSEDAFLTVLDSQGGLWYSRFIGWENVDTIFGVALDEKRMRILVAGTTSSTDLPCTPGCYNPIFSGSDRNLFIASLSRLSYEIEYCTYIGSSDVASYIGMPTRPLCLDDTGSLVVGGSFKGTDFPTTTGALSRNCHGLNTDAFLLTLDPTPVPPPSPPSGFRAVAGDSFVNLTWKRSTNESYVTIGYSLYRGLTPYQLDHVANITGMVSYNDTDVMNGKRYYYELRAINSMGEGEPAGPIVARPVGPLTEPIGLRASTGNGTVVLTWSAPASTGGAEILGYHIMRGPAEEALGLLETIPPQANYTDTQVVPGTIYLYSVKAFNEVRNGTMSLPIAVEALDRPSPPGGFNLTWGKGWVALEWDEPAETGGAPLLGFNIFRGTSPDEMSLLVTRNRYELGYNDTGVEGGIVYYYSVVAITKVGEGRPTNALEAKPTGMPGSPEGFEAKPGDKQASLSWAPPATDRGSPLTGYKLYMGPEEGTLLEIAKLGDVRQYVKRGLENGQDYFFSLSAINLNGEGPRTPVVKVTPRGVPTAPTGLAFTLGDGNITLSWRLPTDTGGGGGLSYVVLRGPMKDSMAILSTVTGALTYIDSTVELGLTYFYSVLAVNPYGAEGPRTPPLEVLVAFVPGEVADLKATAGEGRVNLTWSPPASSGGVPVTGYVIMRGRSETELFDVGRTTGTSYDDIYVTNGILVWYAVRASNEVGLGPEGSKVSAMPMARPSAPEDLKIIFKDGKAILRWRTPTGQGASVTGYVIAKGTSIAEMGTIIEVGPVTEYTDGQVKDGRVYYYSVSARNPVGEGAKAGPVKLEVPEDIGILRVAALVLGVVLVMMIIILMHRGRKAAPAVHGDGPAIEPEVRPEGVGRASSDEPVDATSGAAPIGDAQGGLE